MSPIDKFGFLPKRVVPLKSRQVENENGPRPPVDKPIIPGVIGLFRWQNPILQRKDPFSHRPALSGSSGRSFRGKLKGNLRQTCYPGQSS